MPLRRLIAILAALAVLVLGAVLMRSGLSGDGARPTETPTGAAPEDPAETGPAIPDSAAPDTGAAPEPPLLLAPEPVPRPVPQPEPEAEAAPDPGLAEEIVEAPIVVAPQARSPGLLDRLSDFADTLTLPQTATPPLSAIEENPEGPYAVVTLCYATNRRLGPYFGDAPGLAFTAERGETSWGLVRVSIPRDHRMGELESPGWVMSLVGSPDPEEHVTLLAAEFLSRDEAMDWMNRQLAQDNAILLYVHGYNHHFEKAARRAGQLTYDLGWRGPSVFFSWPSRGQTAAYTVDRQTAEFSQPFMGDVLRELAARPADRIVVIAHSMGSWLLAEALADLAAEDPEAAARFATLVLAAPDIDVDVITAQLVPAFRALSDITVYASSGDAALEASARVNGFRRIGDTAGGVTLVEGVDMIDATGAVSDFFGHTHYGDNASILSDIFDLVHSGLPPSERPRLTEVRRDDGVFWRINLEGTVQP